MKSRGFYICRVTIMSMTGVLKITLETCRKYLSHSSWIWNIKVLMFHKFLKKILTWRKSYERAAYIELKTRFLIEVRKCLKYCSCRWFSLGGWTKIWAGRRITEAQMGLWTRLSGRGNSGRAFRATFLLGLWNKAGTVPASICLLSGAVQASPDTLCEGTW